MGSVCKACLYERVGLAYWKEPRLCQEVNRGIKSECSAKFMSKIHDTTKQLIEAA